MAADRIDIDAVLDGWRATGADRMDPLRFHRIAALHRRASTLHGAARQYRDGPVLVLDAGHTAIKRAWADVAEGEVR